MLAGILNVFLHVLFVAQSLLSSVDVKDEVGEGGERGNVLFLNKYHILLYSQMKTLQKHKFSPKN